MCEGWTSSRADGRDWPLACTVAGHDPTLSDATCTVRAGDSCRSVRRKQRHNICGHGSFTCSDAEPDAHADTDAVPDAVARVELLGERDEFAPVGLGPERPLHVCDHDCFGLRLDGHHGRVVGGRCARFWSGQRHADAECE